MNGVEGFLTYCQTVCENVDEISCPCVKCGNYGPKVNICTLRDHLIINGIDKSYINWVHHGENYYAKDKGNVTVKENDFDFDAPHIAQMVDDLQDELLDDPDKLQSLLSDA